MKMRRILWLPLALCLLVLLTATGTLANLTVEKTTYNYITVGRVEAALVEAGASRVENLLPGVAAEKSAQVENCGDVPIFVRVRVEKAISPADAGTEHILLNIDSANWAEQGGCYYFRRALEPGQTTPPLFTSVTVDPGMGRAAAGVTVEIALQAQAVQSANNDDPLTALGWPAWNIPQAQ